MAATVVVYAGATIVTFLFVLMLSHAGGPSDENDRSREPLLGSVGGLGFAGLVLFTLYLGSPANAAGGYSLPAAPVTADEATALRSGDPARVSEAARTVSVRMKPVAGDRARQVAGQADAAAANPTGDAPVILAGAADLPARNVANVGYLLYSEHLLAVELAGTLLLVATVGAVAVAGRRQPA
jgi:NADH:ubiquinone oxidoreductase subunit 6 (subunit J)